MNDLIADQVRQRDVQAAADQILTVFQGAADAGGNDGPAVRHVQIESQLGPVPAVIRFFPDGQ